MFPKHIAAAAIYLFHMISAGPTEIVILANCINVSNPLEQSSEMAYYSQPQDSSPAAIAKVQTPFGRTVFGKEALFPPPFPMEISSAVSYQRFTPSNALMLGLEGIMRVSFHA
jgi:hypothetical protein